VIHGDLHAFPRQTREDVHRAIVLDVDFAAGFFDEALDVLAARSDQRADLLGVDLQRGDARSVLADFLARFGEMVLAISAQDRQAGDAGLFDRFGHDRVRNALELEVELEAGDPLLCSGDFAIHVAERIFPADDVGEQLVAEMRLSPYSVQMPTLMPATGRIIGTPASMNASVPPQTGHGGGTVRLHDLAGDAHGVGIRVSGIIGSMLRSASAP
jgi:hypothetical protein